MSDEIAVADLAIGLEQGEILVVDVRPDDEVTAGHIPGALIIGMTSLAAWLRDPAEGLIRARRDGHTSVAVIAGCAARFGAARAMFAEVGTVVVGVRGEVAAWRREGRPLNRGR